MSETERNIRRFGPGRRLGAVVVLLFCLVALPFLGLKLYLNGSQGPRLLSRILTTYLRHPLEVSATSLEGDVISLRGISLANPPGTVPGFLCRVETLTIAPDWGGLLRGKRSLKLLALSGVRVDLRRNSAGVWNFSPLQRLLASRKPSGAEFSIALLRVSDGALSINGRELRGLNLRLTDLTTRGSSDARLELSFRDPGRNRYTLTGSLRPGTEPILDLTLSAPSIAPASLAGMFGMKGAPLLAESRAGVRMNATLHGTRLRIRGSLDVTGLPRPRGTAGNHPSPSLNGKIDLVAGYDMAVDRARLESLVLKLNDRVVGHAAATLEEARTRRRFSVDLGISRVELSRLGFLLPERERERTTISGSVEARGIHLEGDAHHGVTMASGGVTLRNASLKRDGRLIFDGVNAPLSLSRRRGGYAVQGSLTRGARGGGGLLESLDAPFLIALTNRLALEGARLPHLSARIMGLSVSGRGGFDPAAANPLNAGLVVSAPSLARVVSHGGISGLKIGSGGCTLSLDATGRGIRDFVARARLRLNDVTGARGNHSLVLGNGRLDTRLVMSRGTAAASGTGRLSSLGLGAKRGDARFDFGFSGETVRLRDFVARLTDGSFFSLPEMELRLPVRENGNGRLRIPLSARFSGGSINREGVLLEGISGMVRAVLVSDGGAQWLEGSSDAAVGGVTWKGKRVGTPRLRLAFSRAGARGELGGTLLGGALDARFTIDPFAMERGMDFQGRITGARAAMIGGLLPPHGDARLSNGTLAMSFGGRRSGDGTVSVDFQSAGSGLEVRGAGNKTLVSTGGYRLTGSFSPERLRIDSARIMAGERVRIEANGDIANPLSRQRTGSVGFTLAATPLNDIIDPFVNLLPRPIQEAGTNGSLASRARLTLHEGRMLLEGSLTMGGVVLDVPSQKLTIADISGTIPFSLDLSGTTQVETHHDAPQFTRAQYPRLLELFRGTTGGGQSLVIGSASFGPLSLGKSSFRFSAGNGVTRMDSLRSSLFGGELMGSGSLTFAEGLRYRGDLLINGLSLKQLCASIPTIRDYISGRVDGFISLGNRGRGVAGLAGFSQLWAREGNGEKMLVSRVFLQKLSGKNLSGFFFRTDRPFDQAEISADLRGGFLTFETLDISHTSFFGVRDLSVTIAPSQNRIALDHLFNSIKQAAARGKAAAGGAAVEQPPAAEPEFTWDE